VVINEELEKFRLVLVNASDWLYHIQIRLEHLSL